MLNNGKTYLYVKINDNLLKMIISGIELMVRIDVIKIYVINCHYFNITYGCKKNSCQWLTLLNWLTENELMTCMDVMKSHVIDCHYFIDLPINPTMLSQLNKSRPTNKEFNIIIHLGHANLKDINSSRRKWMIVLSWIEQTKVYVSFFF